MDGFGEDVATATLETEETEEEETEEKSEYVIFTTSDGIQSRKENTIHVDSNGKQKKKSWSISSFFERLFKSSAGDHENEKRSLRSVFDDEKPVIVGGFSNSSPYQLGEE